ncbi:BgTH12-03000 [Blumeria graminis f. sp. triticale]|uniref:BgtAc-31029 n=3 Tax=Blumeria graminis TaxID=34373 RepID=A0A9X9QDM4_BLUGR|nr:hypothetical protein BGT96224_Ac31029 [Blumeria graminis f. sp. tritici 96224]CAD6503333.1 BgTH12-03000 [Blumeria graminis f. sp. triticale]VDB89368.1 BgtAc-31029 [Blumeria graminis f. sp. tritici]
MIPCAYALLLLQRGATPQFPMYFPGSSTIKLPVYSNRLVILGSHGRNSFYGVYEPIPDFYFPTIDPKYGITATKDGAFIKSTHLKAYCSPEKSTMEIIEIIVKELVPLKSLSYLNSCEAQQKDSACMGHIKNIWNTNVNDIAIPSKNLRNTRKCTHREIVNLAYQGLIKVTGVYRHFSPPGSESEIKVVMNDKINIFCEVARYQIFAENRNKTNEIVLAWYFGNLHVFEVKKGLTILWPKTTVGMEEKNGALIETVLRNNLGAFKDLDELIGEFWLEIPLSDICKRFGICNKEQLARRRSQIMAEVSSLCLGTLSYTDSSNRR